jgi:hypothetical protein
VAESAHGINEMNRHTREGGKQAGEVFNNGTPGEGMRAAVSEVRRGWPDDFERASRRIARERRGAWRAVP